MARRRRGAGGDGALKKMARYAEVTDTSWQKRARCFVCEQRFVVNNYEDKKARVNQHKILGKIVCIWCRGRGGKRFVQMRLLIERVAKMSCQKYTPTGYTPPSPSCKCEPCVARRLIEKWEK